MNGIAIKRSIGRAIIPKKMRYYFREKRERLLLKIAHKIHGLIPSTCWAEWVSFAYRRYGIGTSFFEALRSGKGCAQDMLGQNKGCYCGQYHCEELDRGEK